MDVVPSHIQKAVDVINNNSLIPLECLSTDIQELIEDGKDYLSNGISFDKYGKTFDYSYLVSALGFRDKDLATGYTIARGASLNVVRNVINRHLNNGHIYDLDVLMTFACYNNNISIIEYIHTVGLIRGHIFQFHDGLIVAISLNNHDVIKYIFKHDRNIITYFDHASMEALINDIQTIELLIDLLPQDHPFCWDTFKYNISYQQIPWLSDNKYNKQLREIMNKKILLLKSSKKELIDYIDTITNESYWEINNYLNDEIN
jgi:hypothetical protein